jgi:pSer/pThr/pTyr-binding forkhead associated (FHA) protein
MIGRRLSYAEHVAFYQRQQLFRKRKQFELMGHPAEAPTTVQPRPTPQHATTADLPDAGAEQPLRGTATLQIPIAPPVDRTVRARLRVGSGTDAGAEFSLPEGEYVIGRSADANIRLTDATVSHHHAKILVTARRATIQDLGSLNGSKLGDVTLRGTAIVSPGDRIVLGQTELFVEQGD